VIAAEIVSPVLATVVGVLINFASGNAGNVFAWALVATATLATVAVIYRQHTGRLAPGGRRWTIVALGVVALVLVGSGVYEATRPPAASCDRLAEGAPQTDPRTNTRWPAVYLCPKPGNALVYEHPARSSLIVGFMAPGDSWVVCWRRVHGVIWYYTQGDEHRNNASLHAWGYMSQDALRLRTEPDPAVPRCSATVP
jgi:hypothetical protein